eukprot:1161212-Pelagomonas_calceolata.AAC.20
MVHGVVPLVQAYVAAVHSYVQYKHVAAVHSYVLYKHVAAVPLHVHSYVQYKHVAAVQAYVAAVYSAMSCQWHDCVQLLQLDSLHSHH